MTDGLSETARTRREAEEWIEALEGALRLIEGRKIGRPVHVPGRAWQMEEILRKGDPKECLAFLCRVRVQPGISKDPESLWMRLKAHSPFAGKTLLWLERRTNGSALSGEVEQHLLRLVGIATVELMEVANEEVYVLSPPMPRKKLVDLPDP